MKIYITCLLAVLSAINADNDENIIYLDQLGVTIDIKCSNEVQNGTIVKWQLDDIDLSSEVLSDQSKLQLSGDLQTLTVIDATYPFLARYKCILQQEDSDTLITYTTYLKLRQGSTWDTYGNQVIIGCVAAAVCLVMFVFIMCIYYNRWQAKNHHDELIEEGYKTNRSQPYASAPSYTIQNDTPQPSHDAEDSYIRPYDSSDGYDTKM